MEKVEELRKNQEKSLLKQQELSNLIHEKRYHEALSLALTMEKPHHTLNIVRRESNHPLLTRDCIEGDDGDIFAMVQFELGIQKEFRSRSFM